MPPIVQAPRALVSTNPATFVTTAAIAIAITIPATIAEATADHSTALNHRTTQSLDNRHDTTLSAETLTHLEVPTALTTEPLTHDFVTAVPCLIHNELG